MDDFQTIIDGLKELYTDNPINWLKWIYDKSPKKLFTNEEFHYYGITGLPLLVINFSPFLVAALMVWVLGLA